MNKLGDMIENILWRYNCLNFHVKPEQRKMVYLKDVRNNQVHLLINWEAKVLEFNSNGDTEKLGYKLEFLNLLERETKLFQAMLTVGLDKSKTIKVTKNK
jgi:hypothetical protein